MPQYRFHVDDRISSSDDVQAQLPGIDEAREEAIDYAGELLRDGGVERLAVYPLRVRVTDERGREVVCLEIRDLAQEGKTSGHRFAAIRPWF